MQIWMQAETAIVCIAFTNILVPVRAKMFARGWREVSRVLLGHFERRHSVSECYEGWE